jgi:hypothetical protein
MRTAVDGLPGALGLYFAGRWSPEMVTGNLVWVLRLGTAPISTIEGSKKNSL